jgi:hypothetical protein
MSHSFIIQKINIDLVYPIQACYQECQYYFLTLFDLVETIIELKKIKWRTPINSITFSISLCENYTALNMAKFVILKTFDVKIHSLKPPKIKKIL